MPMRLQRKRLKGHRLPAGVICVTRPGKWGNPFHTKSDGRRAPAALSVDQFERWLTGQPSLGPETFRFGPGGKPVPPSLEEVRRELGGRSLACYCDLDKPCHADVLLRLANDEPGPRAVL